MLSISDAGGANVFPSVSLTVQVKTVPCDKFTKCNVLTLHESAQTEKSTLQVSTAPSTKLGRFMSFFISESDG